MCSKTDAREIKQLWYAAKLYYSLLPKNIDKKEMSKTVGQWSKECESSDDFHMTPLFSYSCHVASCAIRLYSIDEKKNYKRYSDYQDWWNNPQKGRKSFVSQNTGRIIHCVLRNLVAHGEEKCANTIKRSYQELKQYYQGLHFNELDQGMKDVINSIAQDLKNDGIAVDSFA
jgi:hypothetical protein